MVFVLRCDECGKELVMPREMFHEDPAYLWDRYRPFDEPMSRARPDRCPECRERLAVEPIFDFAFA